MWFFVMRVNVNQEGTQQNSIQRYTERDQAFKRYYSILATDIDNDNYQFELVQIVRDDGICLATQTFDRRPQEAGEETV